MMAFPGDGCRPTAGVVTTSVVTTAPPAEEPVSVAAAKAHLRVEHAVDDAFIADLIAAARDATEREARQRWVTQAVEVTLSGWPAGGSPIELPVSPVTAVTAITYTDAAGVDRTLDAGGWQTWAAHRPPLVAPAAGTGWPAVRGGTLAPVRLSVTAGYGGAADVPPVAKQAILLALGYWYDGNRGDRDEPAQAVSARLGLPSAAVNLLALLGQRTYL